MVVRSNRLQKCRASFLVLHSSGPDKQSALLISLVLTAALLFAEFYYSRRTDSLLLFCTGLVQYALTVFIALRWFAARQRGTAPSTGLKLATTLIGSFFLLLLTGYVFLEIHLRLSVPVNVATRQALPVMAGCLVGNIFLLRLLPRAEEYMPGPAAFHLPISGAPSFFGAALASSAIIHLTDMDILDTIVGSLMGIALFAGAGFTLIDAYWKIREISQSSII